MNPDKARSVGPVRRLPLASHQHSLGAGSEQARPCVPCHGSEKEAVVGPHTGT